MSMADRRQRYQRALQPQPVSTVGVASLVTPVARTLIETQLGLDEHAARSSERFGEDGVPPTGLAVTSLKFSASVAVHFDGEGIALAPRYHSDSAISVAFRFLPVSLPELLSDEE